ncbi:hypothetical protein EDB92DRAFT_1814392 [Lactarius akahatsu]|uniref:Uncharacterized protein n=1 Tax=Lactarius akahatsu TaxID=416441 RepID=A0AAD4LL86_9AGAM|nr:hypothetical protein EDB92DRAFT_1814392 [Lactarius akahatsu]
MVATMELLSAAQKYEMSSVLNDGLRQDAVYAAAQLILKFILTGGKLDIIPEQHAQGVHRVPESALAILGGNALSGHPGGCHSWSSAHVGFPVYEAILATSSSAFNHIFSLAQPSNETVDVLSIVQLSEGTSDSLALRDKPGDGREGTQSIPAWRHNVFREEMGCSLRALAPEGGEIELERALTQTRNETTLEVSWGPCSSEKSNYGYIRTEGFFVCNTLRACPAAKWSLAALAKCENAFSLVPVPAMGVFGVTISTGGNHGHFSCGFTIPITTCQVEGGANVATGRAGLRAARNFGRARVQHAQECKGWYRIVLESLRVRASAARSGMQTMGYMSLLRSGVRGVSPSILRVVNTGNIYSVERDVGRTPPLSPTLAKEVTCDPRAAPSFAAGQALKSSLERAADAPPDRPFPLSPIVAPSIRRRFSTCTQKHPFACHQFSDN